MQKSAKSGQAGGKFKAGGGGSEIIVKSVPMKTSSIQDTIVMLRKAVFDDDGKDKDVTEGIMPFMCYDKQGLDMDISFSPKLTKKECKWAFDLIKENMEDRLAKYIHKLNLNYGTLTTINNKNPNKILVVDNLTDFNKFELEYLKPNKFINWHKVSKNYGGIEICPYFISKRTTRWYYPWDVASGCIWNSSIIKNTEVIYQKKNNKYVKIN